MSELDNIIQQTISLVSSRTLGGGFGIPLILDYHTRWVTNRVRTYGALADMTADGFLTTDNAYLAANALLSQSGAPAQFKVGRRANGTQETWQFTPLTATNTRYAFGVAITGSPAQTVQFTSSATANTAEILNGLSAAVAALNSYAAAGLTASTATGLVQIQAPAGVGPRFGVLMLNAPTLYTPANFSLWQETTTDAGIQADINAVIAEDPNWYGIMSTSKGAAEYKQMSALIETLHYFNVQASMDSNIKDPTQTLDLGSSLQSSQYQRTALLYNDFNYNHPDAATLGRWLPYIPGSETMMFKTLTGQTPTNLSATDRNTLTTKSVNYYYAVGLFNIFEHGVTPSGQFMDVIRYSDWVYANIQSNLIALFTQTSPGKIPIADDHGIEQIGGVVLSVLQQGENNGGGVKGSSIVTLPAASSLAPGDVSNRYLNKITWTQQLAGAVHSLKLVGTLHT